MGCATSSSSASDAVESPQSSSHKPTPSGGQQTSSAYLVDPASCPIEAARAAGLHPYLPPADAPLFAHNDLHRGVDPAPGLTLDEYMAFKYDDYRDYDSHAGVETDEPSGVEWGEFLQAGLAALQASLAEADGAGNDPASPSAVDIRTDSTSCHSVASDDPQHVTARVTSREATRPLPVPGTNDQCGQLESSIVTTWLAQICDPASKTSTSESMTPIARAGSMLNDPMLASTTSSAFGPTSGIRGSGPRRHANTHDAGDDFADDGQQSRNDSHRHEGGCAIMNNNSHSNSAGTAAAAAGSPRGCGVPYDDPWPPASSDSATTSGIAEQD